MYSSHISSCTNGAAYAPGKKGWAHTNDSLPNASDGLKTLTPISEPYNSSSLDRGSAAYLSPGRMICTQPVG